MDKLGLEDFLSFKSIPATRNHWYSHPRKLGRLQGSPGELGERLPLEVGLRFPSARQLGQNSGYVARLVSLAN